MVGRRRPTIVDVARHLGISAATVSRALRDKPGIGEVMRVKIKATAAAMDYVPNHVGAALSTGRSRSILFVVPYSIDEVPHTLHMQVLEGLSEEVSAHGYKVEIMLERSLRQRSQTIADAVCHSHADAAVLILMRAQQREFAKVSFSIPVVVVNQVIDGLDVDFVVADDQSGAFDATRHLIAEGHRKIAHVGGPLQYYSNARRYEGYETALAASSLKARAELHVAGDMTEEGGRQAAISLLNGSMKFTAIFCGLDIMAVGVIAALRQAGRAVPEDVSIVGFDDDIFARMLQPPLSTVRKPRYEMGRQAARLLLRRIGTGKIGGGETCILETKLIERGSVLMQTHKSLRRAQS